MNVFIALKGSHFLFLWLSILDAKPSSEYEILFTSKTFSLLQEYFDEIVYWHFQNQA